MALIWDEKISAQVSTAFIAKNDKKTEKKTRWRGNILLRYGKNVIIMISVGSRNE